jgi:outer membrane protein assembly factor BamB
VYFKARGTVLAVDAETGKILWRRYVGYANDNPPVSLGDAATDGVLLSDGREGELQRISDNKIQWRSLLGEPFHTPVVDSRTIYVTSAQGNVFALDAETGDARWGRSIPQPTSVPPGHQNGTKYLYVVGEHSNLYILDSTSGKCLHSYYLGHESGTINIAPVSLLGHLFVFENAGTDYCIVHILRINEEDGSLKKLSVSTVMSAPLRKSATSA